MLTALLAALLGIASDSPVPATPPAPTIETHAAEEPTEAAAPPKENAQSTVPLVLGGLQFRWRDHPQLRAGSNFRIDFLVKFQWDARDPGDDPSDFDTFEIHRFRLGFDGELFRHIQFSVEREMTEREAGDDGTRDKSAWKDVWVEGNFTSAAQVRGGKFKIPFGLEQLTGISNLDFVYRTLGASYLASGRDVGVMVHGRFFDRGLNYWAGVFRQDGENARSSNIEGAGETVAVRVTGTPFRSVKGLAKTEVGGAFTISALDDTSTQPNGLRGRTVMSQYEFFEPVFVKGQRRRYEIDGDWSLGPVGARAEYTHVLDTRDGQGLADQDLSDARARSWYVSGTWVLTGEKKDRPVEPKRRLGAVEVAARYEHFWLDSAGGEPPALRNPRAELILPNGEHVLSLGINWYITRWVKLQIQTMREQAQDPERSAVPDGAAFWSPVFRFQLGL